MKIALAQQNFRIADFEGNLAKMRECILRAEKADADLVVFSELSVCGYPPLDLLEQEDFIRQCEKTIQELAGLSDKTAIIAGTPALNPGEKGKKLFNAACLLTGGKIQDVRYKTLLPTYDVFDEYRYFEPNRDFRIVTLKGVRIALTICEDIWDDQPIGNVFSHTRLYPVSPMDQLMGQEPDLIINISASPFAANRLAARQEVLFHTVRRYGLPLVYCNQVGAHAELIFDGSSAVIDSQGNRVDGFEPFTEDLRFYDTENLIKPPVHGVEPDRHGSDEDYRLEMIHKALVFGIRDFFSKTGFSRAVLGLSGGIDSAVTLVLACEALGNQNVKPVLMPSRYSSEHSVTDAVRLAGNLGIEYLTIPIDPVMDAFLTQLEPGLRNHPPDNTEENLQARARGVILMALSNKLDMLLLNTSNKSEFAVGYSTLYGDLNGGLSVLGDVYKTDIYRLARLINREKEIIPENILTKPPSAELRPGQKDSDSLPEYDVLDPILYRYLELGESLQTIANEGFSEKLVSRVISLINRSEFKRYQAPPVLRVSSKAFGPGRRIPLVAKY